MPNYSFEVADSCPYNQGQISYAHGWFNANTMYPSTTDLYHPCGTISLIPPNIFTGFQYPRTGLAFIGVGVYTIWLANSREYAEIQLIDTLTGGKSYYVEFYVALGNGLNLAISNIGAYFTNSILLNNNYTVISVIPQVENPNTVFLADTMNWMKVSGTFVANGGEKYITVGCFRDDSLINDSVIAQFGNNFNYSYCYIDDVSVIPVDSLQGIPEFTKTEISLYPNPVSNVLNIRSQKVFEKIIVHDGLGRKMLEINPTNNNFSIELSNFSPGIYFLEAIEPSGNRVVKKFVHSL